MTALALAGPVIGTLVALAVALRGNADAWPAVGIGAMMVTGAAMVMWG